MSTTSRKEKRQLGLQSKLNAATDNIKRLEDALELAKRNGDQIKTVLFGPRDYLRGHEEVYAEIVKLVQKSVSFDDMVRSFENYSRRDTEHQKTLLEIIRWKIAPETTHFPFMGDPKLKVDTKEYRCGNCGDPLRGPSHGMVERCQRCGINRNYGSDLGMGGISHRGLI